MFIVCWSVKGGSGTTVIAGSLALTLARRQTAPVLIVDLAGDLPGVLALPEPDGPGVRDWLAAGSDIGPQALERLMTPVVNGLDLLPVGETYELAPTAERWHELGTWLSARSGVVVVDCGGEPPPELAESATMSLLVIRPCYLAARKASRLQHSSVTGIVLVTEPGRALTRRQIESAVGAPVIAEVPVDPSIARAVDAGLLSVRLPKTLSYPMERVA